MDWADHNVVRLLRDGVEIISMSLDEWMQLGAVRNAVDAALRPAMPRLADPAAIETAAPEAAPPARRA